MMSLVEQVVFFPSYAYATGGMISLSGK